MGVERVLELLKEQNLLPAIPVPDAHAVIPDMASLPVAMQAIQQLRMAGVSVQMHASATAEMGSFKSQFKKADGSGARGAVFGADEVAEGCVTVKSLA